MKQRLSNWISSNWPVFFLIVFEIVLAAKNIVSGTWLAGWDSTQPELNFKLNLMRSLTSVWQEYRGLGLPDGMAHAANIVHLFYVWIISFVVPDNLVRYVFVFLSHLVGGIGMYKLLQYLLKKSNWLALAGAIFYLLNPIAIQMFYQPLELFILHFAGLPWLMLTLMKCLEDGGRRNLIWITVVLLAFVSQNHVPTIFIVTMMAVGLILLVSLITSRGMSFKKVLAVVGVMLGINSFWLLPYMVTTVSNSQVIPQAKMNLLSNPEVILRNAEYGGLSSVARMQGFSLSYEDWHMNGSTGLQMPQWASWWDMTSVVVIMWIVFGLAIVGIIRSIWKRDWRLVAIGLVWIVALFNLGVLILGIAQIMDWVYANVPLYAAVFRFAFTKFSIVFAMTSTILMIYALDGLVKKWGKIVVGIVVVGASLWIGWPVFSGNFLYKELRVNLPREYHSLFKYFDKAEVGRVARLPAFDLWGWESYNWGYRGSGIVWQGVRSPMLVRSFDPWSPYNEGFYNEFSIALYSDNGDQVQKVLGKYDVRYMLLDESVIAPGQDKEILRIDETKKIMEQLGAKQVFKEGFLTVWDMGSRGDQFVSAPSSYTIVDGDMTKVRSDVIYADVGTYVSGEQGIIYPFANLMKEEVKGVEYEGNGVYIGSDLPAFDSAGWDQPLRSDPEERELIVPGWKVGDIVKVNFENNESLPAYSVNGEAGPKFLGKEKPEEGKNYLVARVSEGEEWKEYLEQQKFDLQGSSLKVQVEGESKVYDFGKEGKEQISNCDVLRRGRVEKNSIEETPPAFGVPTLPSAMSPVEESPLTGYVADERGAACDYVSMKELDSRLSYLMRVQGENNEGRSLKFFLYNTGSKRNDIEWLMGKDKFDQTFALLPWAWDGFYSLNIETRSFGQRAENMVEPVEVRWFPLEQIARAKVISTHGETPPAFGVPTWPSAMSPVEESPQQVQTSLRVTEVKKTGTWLYRVKVEGNGLLKLSQGYDEGWIAPPIKHVKVDGWANGWMIGDPKSQISNSQISNRDTNITNSQIYDITIFYWPQLLEYLGFGILGVTIWVLIKKK